MGARVDVEVQAGPSMLNANVYTTPKPWYEEYAYKWVTEYYDSRHPPVEGEKIPLAIDVACGSSFLCKELTKRCHRVIGVDMSSDLIAAAQVDNTRSPRKVEFKKGSALNLSSVCRGELADLITVRMAIVNFNTRKFFSEVRRVLKPGGVLGVFGYKTAGIQIEGAELIDFLMEESPNEPMESIITNLHRSYLDCHVPFSDIERKAHHIPIDMNRSGIKELCFEQGSEEARKRIDEILQRLPPLPTDRQGRYEVSITAFGILTHV